MSLSLPHTDFVIGLDILSLGVSHPLMLLASEVIMKVDSKYRGISQGARKNKYFIHKVYEEKVIVTVHKYVVTSIFLKS